MTFDHILEQALDMLRRRGRVSYCALKRQFDLDDDYLIDLKDEILYSQCDVVEDGERGLICTGEGRESVRNGYSETEKERRFQALLLAVIGLLRHERRITYRTLKYALTIDDTFLTDIREELRLRRLALDEEGKVLVWTGEPQSTPLTEAVAPSQPVTAESMVVSSVAVPIPPPHVTPATPETNGPTASPEASVTDVTPDEPVVVPEPVRVAPEAERRQLTVMFCDLVGSTDLSGKLDPEDLREVVRAYQETAAEVIQRYEGHIAQYLGDGLLIYFGFPVAHEDDAQRALYTGLGIPKAMATLNTRLEVDYGVQLAVRIGIHTGLVVVGEMGGGGRHENLALGETPNIAARLEGLAQANTAIISPVTAQLVQRSFVLEELGLHELKGVSEPMMLYTVVGPRDSEYDDHEGLLSGGFDALVGRDEEIGLLLRRWEQSKEGQGQVVLINGEAGLGKSSLVEGLRAHVQHDGYTRIAFRCSPYTANSALHPVIEHLQRVFDWQREDTDETKVSKLEQGLQGMSLPLDEAVPLVAALLSLPLPEGRYRALTLSPPQQRQQTQDVLVAWMLEESERQPLLAIWEDLYWADPSTLELLGLFIDQAATVPMMNVLAYWPAFTPPWPMQSHLTPITLNRLERVHIEALVMRLASGKDLPAEVVAHIVTKTDGVPLYVEELTKMLLESDLLQEAAEQYVLTGSLSEATISATLQDSLMARLDRLPMVKEVAQLAAVLGREFAYEMLHALAAVDEPTLQDGLGQLVKTELLYQRGRIPRAKYIFRHALIRDAAYESLLRRTRQHYHQQVAELLEEGFPDVVEMQPELVAYHYTEASRAEPAVAYWQQAGQVSLQRSAHQEAIGHLSQGLELLATLPESPERAQQELDFHMTLGSALMAVKGFGHLEVEQSYLRARALCQQLGNPSEVLTVLWGLCRYYRTRGELQTARELSEELLTLTQHQNDATLLLPAYQALGSLLYVLGEFESAKVNLEHGIAQQVLLPQHHSGALYGQDPGVQCYQTLAWVLWYLGYPDQALQRTQEAYALAQTLSHTGSQAMTLYGAARLHQFRRDIHETYEHAEATITFCTEWGIAYPLPTSTFVRGWALAEQGQRQDGIDQMHQGLSAIQASGNEVSRPHFLIYLADIYRKEGQVDNGFSLVAEARELMEKNGQRYIDAELYRIEGELRLQQAALDSSQAETYFQQALDIAGQQQAKSLELRAAMSMARLWQQEGKQQEAHELLALVYGWFTEGFDTADLIDAKTLLDELRK